MVINSIRKKMSYLVQNIKYLRRKEALTQQQFADLLQIKRSLVGAYEEGRAQPKMTVMQSLCAHFGLSLDQLINSDLEKSKPAELLLEKSPLRILPIVVGPDNRERIPIVPVKASAGYLNGLADPEFIGSLPVFAMPIPELSAERTYRVFQIKGDSMLPVPSGAYIFCEFVEQVRDIKNGQACIVITRDEGLVYKRVYQQQVSGQLLLVSDNKEYEPYLLEEESLLEIWAARGVLSFDL